MERHSLQIHAVTPHGNAMHAQVMVTEDAQSQEVRGVLHNNCTRTRYMHTYRRSLRGAYGLRISLLQDGGELHQCAYETRICGPKLRTQGSVASVVRVAEWQGGTDAASPVSPGVVSTLHMRARAPLAPLVMYSDSGSTSAAVHTAQHSVINQKACAASHMWAASTMQQEEVCALSWGKQACTANWGPG